MRSKYAHITSHTCGVFIATGRLCDRNAHHPSTPPQLLGRAPPIFFLLRFNSLRRVIQEGKGRILIGSTNKPPPPLFFIILDRQAQNEGQPKETLFAFPLDAGQGGHVPSHFKPPLEAKIKGSGRPLIFFFFFLIKKKKKKKKKKQNLNDSVWLFFKIWLLWERVREKGRKGKTATANDVDFLHKISFYASFCGLSILNYLLFLRRTERKRKRKKEKKKRPDLGASIFVVFFLFWKVSRKCRVWVRAEDSPGGCTRKIK